MNNTATIETAPPTVRESAVPETQSRYGVLPPAINTTWRDLVMVGQLYRDRWPQPAGTYRTLRVDAIGEISDREWYGGARLVCDDGREIHCTVVRSEDPATGGVATTGRATRLIAIGLVNDFWRIDHAPEYVAAWERMVADQGLHWAVRRADDLGTEIFPSYSAARDVAVERTLRLRSRIYVVQSVRLPKKEESAS